MFRQVANSRKQHLSAEIGCHPEQVKRRLTQAYKNQKQHQIADNGRAHARKKTSQAQTPLPTFALDGSIRLQQIPQKLHRIAAG
jgi:hypothetical protein